MIVSVNARTAAHAKFAGSMVTVPEHPPDEPRVVSIPGARLRDAAIALAVIAERLNPSDATEEAG
jgi:hypothetical protein